jgi:uncharacterized protein (DUF2236 family)
MARPPVAPKKEAELPEANDPRVLRWIAIGAFALAAILFAIPRIRRELQLRKHVRAIVERATPAEIRARIDELVRVDVREQSDRGDAYRALISLLTAAERDRDIGVDAEDEIARRVRDLLTISRR